MFKAAVVTKRFVIFAAWIGCVLALAFLSSRNPVGVVLNQGPVFDAEGCPGKNEIGAVTYTHWEKREPGRIHSIIHFDHFLAENSNIAAFKTSLFKSVKISGLSLKIYQYCDNETEDKSLTNLLLVSPETQPTALANLRNGQLPGPADGWRINNIDLSNIAEVYISDFDYKLFHDYQPYLSVHCKRAEVSYKRPGILLRGHVTIKGLNGDMLQCNCLTWDVTDNHFITNGPCILQRNSRVITGADLSVDYQLNILDSKGNLAKKQEEQKCLVKL